MSLSTEELSPPNIVFIGAGPVGLWTAIQTKLRNPALKIVMYEKYEEYQRLHTLQLNKHSYEGIPDDPRLQSIVDSFSSHVKTSEIEEKFKAYAEDLGIEFCYEAVENCEEFAQKFPDDTVIVGSDGSHSIVHKEIFNSELQYEEDMQYVAELKYFVKGPTSKLNPILEGIPVMTHSKFTVQETVGKEKDGMTPVTLRFFVDEQTFNHMRGEDGKGATFKKPFRYNDLNQTYFPRDLAKSMKAWLSWRRKIKHERRIEFEVDNINGEKITAINLAVYASKEFVKEAHGKTWAKVGDALAGFPYYRALNAGLLCGTQLALALSEHFSSMGNSFEDYKAYVQERINKEKRTAKFKNKALNLGRFVVDTCVADNHISRSKLAMVQENETIDVVTILTFYLLENYEGLSDGPKYHELADYFTGDDLLTHAQEFTEHLATAYNTVKLNLGEDCDDEKLNIVANTFKANIYKEIVERQGELRNSRWKTAWILSIAGLALPILSHLIIWAWYFYRRVNEPLKAITIDTKELCKIYDKKQGYQSTVDILHQLNEKEPVREKQDELRARRAVVPILAEESDKEEGEDSEEVRLVDDFYNISAVQIISTNWNRQAKRFENKLSALKENFEDHDSIDSISVL